VELALYSNDQELYSLCQEIVKLAPPGKCTVKASLGDPRESPAEVAIYDTTLGPVENLLGNAHLRSSILIVSRAELPEVLNKALHFKAIVLLKPISRARLEIAIEESSSGRGGAPDSHRMRLNGDALLECLLHANLRLQEYDQDRSHFLARAIHELRAPLTSLNGYCGLFLDRKLGHLSGDQIHVLTRMRRSVQRLNRIVSTMFDLSMGRSCDYTPNYQAGNIVACIEQALHEIGPALRDRRIELDVDLTPPGAPLLFDAQQMEQVFLNLLDNSCKFTGRGGYVKVSGFPYFWERRSFKNAPVYYPGDRRKSAANERRPNAYRINMSDNGSGIPPDRLDTLFTEYSVYGGGNDRSGAGLGLAISRMILRQHGGSIWAESHNYEGACFCIVLPYHAACPPVTALVGAIAEK
jgi:signal transduction histidine kinase